MRIVLFNPSWHTLGGGEKYLLTMADVLSSGGRHTVRLLADRPGPSLDDMRRYFHLSLENVAWEQCASRNVAARLGDADTAVVESNFRSFGLPARRMVYILQVPYGPIGPRALMEKALAGQAKDAAKDILRLRLLRTAKHASLVLANSVFSANALRHHHGINARVLYPPIDAFTPAARKFPRILSVGRFFAGAYNDKRYDVLLEGFRTLQEQTLQGTWEYHLAGSAPNDERTRSYLERLRVMAGGLPVHFHVNAPYETLQRLYAEASVFWHAAGFGVNEERHPERTEHFGMSTVEAMAAGCVPVVTARGGQREIVSHGESGYLWSTIDELAAHTRALLEHSELRDRLAHGARRRAADFSREKFAERCLTLFETLES